MATADPGPFESLGGSPAPRGVGGAVADGPVHRPDDGTDKWPSSP